MQARCACDRVAIRRPQREEVSRADGPGRARVGRPLRLRRAPLDSVSGRPATPAAPYIFSVFVSAKSASARSAALASSAWRTGCRGGVQDPGRGPTSRLGRRQQSVTGLRLGIKLLLIRETEITCASTHAHRHARTLARTRARALANIGFIDFRGIGWACQPKITGARSSGAAGMPKSLPKSLACQRQRQRMDAEPSRRRGGRLGRHCSIRSIRSAQLGLCVLVRTTPRTRRPAWGSLVRPSPSGASESYQGLHPGLHVRVKARPGRPGLNVPV